MKNAEIRKKLMRAKKGDTLVVGGSGFKIVEVVDYNLHTAAWRDILCRGLGNIEVVFELADRDMVTVWHEVGLPEPIVFGGIIIFDGKEFSWEESGKPRVAVNGEDEEDRIDYAVYVRNRTVICLEQWSGVAMKAYKLMKEIPLSRMGIVLESA